MGTDIDDFRARVIAHAKLMTSRAPKVDNEAKTNSVLVQPFLSLLGYDVTNPDEVSPEHHADFSEKYQNKVDYAILHKGVPVIAIESKRLGSPLKDDRGQLRSYFNACPTVKLGILTDGMRFEFYADSDKPNMMDDTAFLFLDMFEVNKNASVDDNTLSGVFSVRNGAFNPEDVGAEARRKLLLQSIVEVLKQSKVTPSDELVRFLLGSSSIGGKIQKVTQKIIDSNRDIVRAAMEAFVAQEALARFGFAPKDVVKTVPAEAAVPVDTQPTAEPEQELFAPTDGELKMLDYAKSRLFFLVREETLFAEVQKVTFRKSKTSFRVFYGKPNNGSIFDYREHRDGEAIVFFPALAGLELPAKPSPEFDESLTKVFSQRVRDAGVKTGPTVSLRAIRGGQE